MTPTACRFFLPLVQLMQLNYRVAALPFSGPFFDAVLQLNDYLVFKAGKYFCLCTFLGFQLKQWETGTSNCHIETLLDSQWAFKEWNQ